MTAKNDRLVTVKEMQDRLAVSRSKCFELIRTGRVEVVRLGQRCTRIKLSSIERLIANGGSK